MIINYSLYDYTRPMLTWLRIIYLIFLFIYPLMYAKCVSTILNITVFTPVIKIGVLASIIIQVHIHTRLLIKCLPLGKYK
jgi:hypothetical protein